MILNAEVVWMCQISEGGKFKTEGASWGKQRCQILWSYRAECVEFLSHRRSGAVVMECTHEINRNCMGGGGGGGGVMMGYCDVEGLKYRPMVHCDVTGLRYWLMGYWDVVGLGYWLMGYWDVTGLRYWLMGYCGVVGLRYLWMGHWDVVGLKDWPIW